MRDCVKVVDKPILMPDGYLNLPPAERDGFVYRMVRLEYLYELFIQRENVLVRPEIWDDQYENIRARLGQSVGDHCCYGQCWTLNKASDAMWRIYSPMPKEPPRKYTVRIRSTIHRLFESLSACCKSSDSAFIGKVRYLNTPALIKYIKRSSNASLQSEAESLLVKRPAFRHERAIRLLLVTNSNSGRLFRYPVDPNGLVCQMMLDPRLDPKQAEELKREVRTKTGFEGPIKRSLLYEEPVIMKRTLLVERSSSRNAFTPLSTPST
jgi:hypothetical protein